MCISCMFKYKKYKRKISALKGLLIHAITFLTVWFKIVSDNFHNIERDLASIFFLIFYKMINLDFQATFCQNMKYAFIYMYLKKIKLIAKNCFT